MAVLHEILAIEKSVKGQSHKAISDLYKKVQKAEPFNGLSKVYQPLDENGKQLPAEHKKVQLTVSGVIVEVKEAKEDLWNVVSRQEHSNQFAKADIIVDGTTVLSDVPVTYLLFLEKELTDIRTFVDTLPVLDTNEDWRLDINSGLHKTEEVLSHRTEKSETPIVMYEATKEHPAQTQMIVKDVLVGYWHTVKMSGAMPIPERKIVAERVEKLLRAVKEARQRGNSIEERGDATAGTKLLNYIFG